MDSSLRPRQDFRGNAALFASTCLAAFAWGVMPEGDGSSVFHSTLAIGAASAAALGAASGGMAMLENFRLRRRWQTSGTAYQEKNDGLISDADRKALGMYEPNGRLLGRTQEGRPVFKPKGAFEFILGGQGTGKTTTAVIISVILTTLLSGKSVHINDPKKEILPQLIAFIRKFKLDHILINIGSGHQDTCPGVEVHPYELAYDAYFSDDRDLHALTFSFINGYAQITVEIPSDAGKASFFFENGQVLFRALFVALLVFEPDNVTPTRIRELASSTSETVRLLNRLIALTPREGDYVVRDGQTDAQNILDLDRENKSYLAQFANKISTALVDFSESGPLAHYGRNAVGRISDARKRPMIVATMTPLALSNSAKMLGSLQAYNFMMSAKAFPRGVKLHGIYDEFQTMTLPDFHMEMLALRGLGVSAEMYVQSRIALAEKFGDKGAAIILEQSDIVQMSGLSPEDAEWASKLFGNRRVRVQSSSVQGDRFDDVSFSFQDQEVPVFSVAELSAMPLDQQVVRIRGHKPDRLLKVPFWCIAGLRELVSDNPLEGPMPKARAVMGLAISKKSIRLKWWRKTKRLVFQTQSAMPKRERFLRLSSCLWLGAFAAIWFGLGLKPQKAEPLFYLEHRTGVCIYRSVDGGIETRTGPSCPPVWLRQ